MLSKSKTKKLSRELDDLGFAKSELATATGVSAPTLRKILNGETYNKGALEILIDLRNQRLSEKTELESKI